MEVNSSGSSSDHLLLSNGTGTASGCSAAYLDGSQASDFSIVSDGCGTANLSIGKSCIVTVNANPAASGPSSANLIRNCSNGGMISLALSAYGVTSHPTQIARSGSDHHCALMSDKTVKCWGSNTQGQIGDGTNTDRSIPLIVPSLNNVTSISAGNGFTCSLISDGTLNCWGNNSSGQLGDATNNSRNSPGAAVSGINNAIQLSAGESHACAVLSDGSVQCWGDNSYAQLGDGTNSPASVSSPITVAGVSNVSLVSAGLHHSCAVLADGSVQCWGTGILGDGNGPRPSAPVSVSLNSIATDITVGRDHSCALLDTGKIECWGENTYGQLGDGTTNQGLLPVIVSGISNAIAIMASPSSDGNSTCALLISGGLKCWGDGQFTQLANSSNASSLNAISALSSGASAIGVSPKGGCSILSGNKIECWGSNSSGEIGMGKTTAQETQQLIAVKNPSLSGANFVSNGGAHTCAIVSGTVKCLGSNTSGQLGDGTNSFHYSAINVPGISNAQALSTGTSHTCALLSSGSVKCWGLNDSGQLGDTTNSDQSSPVSVSGVNSASAIVSGQNHTCALMSGGSVKCWGLNSSGQLGNASLVSSSTAVTVAGVTNATSLAAGAHHTCAVISGGTVKCWGESLAGNQISAVAVSSLSNVADLTAGNNFTCARLTDNTLRCWGSNGSGQFGNGDSVNSNTPITAAASLGNITKIGATANSLCVITSGTTRCFGDNASGQLGNGTKIQSKVPALTIGLPLGATSLMQSSSSAAHSCIIDSSNSVYCFGDNSYSQSGLDLSKPGNSIGI